ncbi:hypothetical protein OF117_01250 [Geodermatophilus sp. YIM 151500]|uniref:hypothetical protein n=1 Tax=Geodermatophilus sp. YIM 151500 TaxID=2984531 RepID=UPI0021E3F902|nr:hypothetical protein [Geodermatophilus sp. YIM 151500]MCV2487975.1 hypothetical protein [Geodermatophilus sp. YIM 151500]
MTSTRLRRRGAPLALAVVSAVGHLVVGWFYAAGGLVIPGAWLFSLWAFWVLLAVLLVRLARRRSWWTPAVPLAAAAVFAGVLQFGERVLGWLP